VAVSLGYKNVYRNPHGFPKWQEQGLPIASSPTGPADPMQAGLNPSGDRSLQGWAMLWTLLGIFAGGLALNLSPCVYPMIPITVSFFGGRAGRDKPSQIKLVFHGICYLIGLALTNSTLGVVAAPCIGPFVLGLLTWVAGMGNPWFGFLIFFILSLGIGLPLFVLALFSSQLQRLPKAGGWMIWVRKLMGWVLVGVAAYFIRPLRRRTCSTSVFFSMSPTASLESISNR
jgi:thiol:disulfide interchange protein DsbD